MTTINEGKKDYGFHRTIALQVTEGYSFTLLSWSIVLALVYSPHPPSFLNDFLSLLTCVISLFRLFETSLVLCYHPDVLHRCYLTTCLLLSSLPRLTDATVRP